MTHFQSFFCSVDSNKISFKKIKVTKVQAEGEDRWPIRNSCSVCDCVCVCVCDLDNKEKGPKLRLIVWKRIDNSDKGWKSQWGSVQGLSNWMPHAARSWAVACLVEVVGSRRSNHFSFHNETYIRSRVFNQWLFVSPSDCRSAAMLDFSFSLRTKRSANLSLRRIGSESHHTDTLCNSCVWNWLCHYWKIT
jgi:hypothetical protein